MRPAAIGLILMLAAACSPASSGHASNAATSPAGDRPGPLVLIVLENHGYDQIAGAAEAPYLNGNFIPAGLLFTDYHALHHPSLPNYLEMVSGQTNGCASDGCPRQRYTADDVFSQLEGAGWTWQAWQEAMPQNCALTNSGTYAVKHNPPAYFASLAQGCARDDVPYPAGLPDPLPDFTFVSPDLCHDLHDCPIAEGDAWLAQHVPPLLERGATVVITFDEGTGDEGGGGHVLTAAVGTGIAAGSSDDGAFDHHSLLAAIEDRFGLARLAGATSATPLPL